jgi:hypothetical protein
MNLHVLLLAAAKFLAAANEFVQALLALLS